MFGLPVPTLRLRPRDLLPDVGRDVRRFEHLAHDGPVLGEEVAGQPSIVPVEGLTADLPCAPRTQGGVAEFESYFDVAVIAQEQAGVCSVTLEPLPVVRLPASRQSDGLRVLDPQPGQRVGEVPDRTFGRIAIRAAGKAKC